MGCNRLTDPGNPEQVAVANAAIDLGVLHFDAADSYGIGRRRGGRGDIRDEGFTRFMIDCREVGKSAPGIDAYPPLCHRRPLEIRFAHRAARRIDRVTRSREPSTEIGTSWFLQDRKHSGFEKFMGRHN